ncbi:MAG: hypothetical protein Q7U04_10785 [Bacteriovorax sp.]|nr:hypothetical protein [Bacteriovorax sp.]
MKNNLRHNIVFSFYEKIGIIISQFISSILLSRFLPREDFGGIAVITGAFAFVQFVNIAIENVLVKDFQTLKLSINESMSQFIQLNIIKVILISICCLSIGYAYYFYTGKTLFLYISCSLLLVLIMDILISPLIIYASLLYKQNLVTKISLIRWSLNVFGLCFLIKFPSLKVVLIKDLVVLVVVLILWYYYASRELKLAVKFQKLNFEFLKNKLLGYSVWVHLIGVISNIVYRADAFILYYFVSLKLIGNYNIALTVANVANIIPSILITQNNVALSHCKTDLESKLITGKFIRFSIYLGIVSLVAFMILGKVYIRLITKSGIDEIYEYLLFIVSGLLIVKMIISPLVSYINIRGNVKKLFFKVQLPLLVLVVCNYVLFSQLWGAKGAAISNLLNGILWLGLIYIEINSYEFKILHIGSFRDDYNQVKSYVEKKFTSLK